MNGLAEKVTSDLYRENFPDYDDVLKVPEGWMDSSDYATCDVCPSISRRIPSKDGKSDKFMTILEDYKDPNRRESPDYPRYAVRLQNDKGGLTQYCETDSFYEAMDVARKVEVLFSQNCSAKGQEKDFFDKYHEKAIQNFKHFDEPYEDEPFQTAVAAATEALAGNALQADVHDWVEKYAPCAKLQPPITNPLGLSYSDAVMDRALRDPEVQKIVNAETENHQR